MVGSQPARNMFSAGTSNGTFRVEQTSNPKVGESHAEYARWLFEQLKDLCTPSMSAHVNKSRSKSDKIVFNTQSNEAFAVLYKAFYPEGIKVVPKALEKVFNAAILSVWFCDDGSMKGQNRRGLHFSTHCFPEEDIQILIKGLATIGIEATIHKQNHKVGGEKVQYLRMQIASKSHQACIRLMSACFPMPYKYPDLSNSRYFVKWNTETTLLEREVHHSGGVFPLELYDLRGGATHPLKAYF